MMDDFDSEPMMAVPSPGAFSLSPKSQTESTASLSADQPSSLEEYPSFTACGLAIAMKVAETFSTDMASSDAAMALRTLAICGGTFRHAGIACAVMPLAELVLLPTIPSSSIRAMADLDAGCVSEDLLALTEHFVAGAMEDCTFIARDHEDGKPPTRREVEAMQKNRLEYWQGMLRNAHLGREMMPNPCREAVLAKMGFANDGIPVAELPLSAKCNTFSFQSLLDEKTAATLAIMELERGYPDLLEHTKLLAHSTPVDPVIEEPTGFQAPETMPGTFAEAFAWFLKAGGNGCSFVSL